MWLIRLQRCILPGFYEGGRLADEGTAEDEDALAGTWRDCTEGCNACFLGENSYGKLEGLHLTVGNGSVGIVAKAGISVAPGDISDFVKEA